MRPALHFLFCLLLLLSGASQAEPINRPHTTVALKANLSTFVPGKSFWVAVHFRPDAHWYTHWQNPGNWGFAPHLDWQLPDGWKAGAIHWQVPKTITIAGKTHFGFEGPSSLLVQLTPPENASNLTLKAKLSWLVCQETCLPEKALLTLPLTAGSAIQSANSGFFAEALAKLPSPLPGRGKMQIEKDVVSFSLKVPELAGQPTQVFVTSNNLVDNNAQPQQIWQGDTLLISLPKSPYFNQLPTAPKVLLTTPDQALLVTMAASDTAARYPSLWLICLMAFAGGLVLNLVPWVLPVLVIKALKCKRDPGFGYLAGVLISLWALTLTLWLLHQGSEAPDWGFNWRSPVWVALQASIFAILGLGLIGKVGRNAFKGVSQRLLRQQPLASFLTGLLAVVVASPSTALLPNPGIDLTQSLWPLLAVCSALGVGFALPMLLLNKLPALHSRLPKPGPWITKAYVVLALPLLLSAIWLLWVLNNLNGQAFGLLATWVVGVAIWLLPWRLCRWLAWLPMLVVALLPLWHQASPPQSLAFDESTLKTRLSQHRPVLVNITADWCISCKVNESTTLSSEETRALFALYDVTYLKGDGTSQSPVIRRFLAGFHRTTVPLYVLYDQQGAPHILPQLLSPQILAAALKRHLEASAKNK
ncbi:protein-disulfide reductase DsbD family protein [Gallaecimonas mangrovi]|uniref:protein-disulfide reductase DsbD family protein n=1 Tax=Gallaecimonas mangrovi TaxID=2291597 RepID=UPI000E1FB5FF|nr:protein-disulfide reductase DsbD domain-containing protein [Gallaecimonas mangrovi]